MSIATSTRQVLIAGQWRHASQTSTFQATDPSRNALLPPEFPVSSWDDCDAALDAAAYAFNQLRTTPVETIAQVLEAYAEGIEAAKDSLVETANAETGLAKSPRLADVELPRTCNQLRLAAQACRTGISAKLAFAGERHDDDARQNPEDDLRRDDRRKVAQPVAAFVAQDDPVDEVTDNSR